jgi:hypothetical protein
LRSVKLVPWLMVTRKEIRLRPVVSRAVL